MITPEKLQQEKQIKKKLKKFKKKHEKKEVLNSYHEGIQVTLYSLRRGFAADRESVFLKSVFVQLYGNAPPMPLAELPIVDPLCAARSAVRYVMLCSHYRANTE